MKRSVPPIEGKRVRLRLLEEADLEMTRAWRNQDHIRTHFFDSHVISAEAQKAWFERYRDKEDDFVFVVEIRADCLPIGQCALYHVDWQKKRGEFGRLMIGRIEQTRQGYASEATGLLVEYALKNLGLTEVYLNVFAANRAACDMYTKCGFVPAASVDGRIEMRKAACDEA